MDLNTIKNLGGIGALILVFASAINLIPVIGPLINLVGAIVVVAAIYGLSKYYNNPDIFKNFIIGVIIYLVTAIIELVVVVFFGISFLGMLALSQSGSNISLAFLPAGSFLASILLLLLVPWIGLMAGSFFIKKSLILSGEVTGNVNFKRAGNLLFVGSVLLILLIGPLIMWIGIIFLAISFFGLKK